MCFHISLTDMADTNLNYISSSVCSYYNVFINYYYNYIIIINDYNNYNFINNYFINAL